MGRASQNNFRGGTARIEATSSYSGKNMYRDPNEKPIDSTPPEIHDFPCPKLVSTGECHLGSNCPFSHQLCCHFAGKACMKGDDCPYDRQLSKYPCNKLLQTGECNRSSKCLFSHENIVSEAESSLSLSSVNMNSNDDDDVVFDYDGMFDNDQDNEDEGDGDDNYLSMQALYDNVDLPPGVEASFSCSGNPGANDVAGSSSVAVQNPVSESAENKELVSEEECKIKYKDFKLFDIVDDFSDHHFKD